MCENLRKTCEVQCQCDYWRERCERAESEGIEMVRKYEEQMLAHNKLAQWSIKMAGHSPAAMGPV